MATNYAVASNQRKTINEQLDDFFGKGNEVKQLGNQMKPTAINFVINPQKISGEKLPPSFKR
ncbi:MAG TPA: hypothetical protein VIH30_03835 [Aquirhabdus sp.]